MPHLYVSEVFILPQGVVLGQLKRMATAQVEGTHLKPDSGIVAFDRMDLIAQITDDLAIFIDPVLQGCVLSLHFLSLLIQIMHVIVQFFVFTFD